MIIELMLKPLWLLLDLIVSLVPNTQVFGLAMTGFTDLIAKGIWFFGASTFALLIGNVVFWNTIQFGWSVVEWVYKKIPGVN